MEQDTLSLARTKMKTKARKKRRRVGRVTGGSGNIFADLGLPNPEQELLKAQLTLQIYTILKDSGKSRSPKFSACPRGRYGAGFIARGRGSSGS